MMMKALGAGGIELLTDQVRQADEDNPNGYYEFEPVKKTKENTAWLADATGKAVKMVYRLLYDLPDDCWYKVLFMQRDLKEVLASQNKMLARSGNSAGTVSDEKMQALFAAELDKCRKWIKEKPNVKALFINHRDMINDGLNQAEKINLFLDGGLNVEAIAAVVDPKLYRNRK
jgi:hypothetical protein